MPGDSMIVDVTWDGVPLAKGAAAREQDGGWFVELEQPMPVGTCVELTGDVQTTASVARVHEGIGAGMLLRRAGSGPSANDGAGGDGSATAANAEPKENGAAGEKKEKRKRKR